jgi:hypothetical protein
MFLSLLVSVASHRQAPLTLADRLPLPDGYGSEQDTEADGVRDFSTAAGVRGHILRRFVQSGDDKASVIDLVAYFSSVIRDSGGRVFDDRMNNIAGRLDGRVPGPRPLWVHIDVSDEGGVVDMLLLEERRASADAAPAAREMPVEEIKVPGRWSTGIAPGVSPADSSAVVGIRDQLAAQLAPIVQPYRGWDWHLVVESRRQIRLFGFARTQACATCAVVTGTREVTVANFDLQPALVVDIPSWRGEGETSLYQQDLIARILAAKLPERIK